MKKLNEDVFRALVGGKFFTVRFVKKDNTIRDLNGRLSVVKHLRGGEDSTSHIDKYINVFESSSDTKYRKVNMETVQTIKVGGKTHVFNEGVPA